MWLATMKSSSGEQSGRGRGRSASGGDQINMVLVFSGFLCFFKWFFKHEKHPKKGPTSSLL